jgi:BolA family transcriptional regulator, general stress-responsive regulator
VSAETVDLLRQRLTVLEPQSLAIDDESHRHAGHAGAKEGGHYKITIVAAAFAGHNTVKRHRMIHAAVGDLMRGRIHALSIRAFSPDEV